MEKIQTICMMRDLVRALAQLEDELVRTCGVGLNEAMVLCAIGRGSATAGDVARCVGLLPPNASKVVRSVERKGLVGRSLGETDHRRMYFTLTPAGLACLDRLRDGLTDIPPLLQPLMRGPEGPCAG